MPKPKEKLWPYKNQLAFLAVPLIWVCFILAFVAGVRMGAWKGEMSGQTVLVVAITSIIPLLLVILDFFALSGAVVDIKGVKLDFGKSQEGRAGARAQGFELPENIGVPGAVISDSTAMSIRRTLNIGAEHGIVVVNIKSGEAWWVTRLLVLCAGAVRMGSPEILVFLGKKENVPNYFLAFGKPKDLLQAILIEPAYRERYDRALLSVRQFLAYKEIKEMVPTPPLKVPALVQRYVSQPDYFTLGDEVAEQILLDQLGNQFFNSAKPGNLEDPPDRITISRLDELFESCLYRDCIDLGGKDEEQLKQLFAAKGDWVALVNNSVFNSMLRKAGGEELILRQVVLDNLKHIV